MAILKCPRDNSTQRRSTCISSSSSSSSSAAWLTLTNLNRPINCLLSRVPSPPVSLRECRCAVPLAYDKPAWFKAWQGSHLTVLLLLVVGVCVVMLRGAVCVFDWPNYLTDRMTVLPLRIPAGWRHRRRLFTEMHASLFGEKWLFWPSRWRDLKTAGVGFGYLQGWCSSGTMIVSESVNPAMECFSIPHVTDKKRFACFIGCTVAL